MLTSYFTDLTIRRNIDVSIPLVFGSYTIVKRFDMIENFLVAGRTGHP